MCVHLRFEGGNLPPKFFKRACVAQAEPTQILLELNEFIQQAVGVFGVVFHASDSREGFGAGGLAGSSLRKRNALHRRAHQRATVGRSVSVAMI
jgi:hypothetical protein